MDAAGDPAPFPEHPNCSRVCHSLIPPTIPQGGALSLENPQSSPHSSFLIFQQNDAKLDEILKELKSIKDTISSQDERISKLEQQMAKIAD